MLSTQMAQTVIYCSEPRYRTRGSILSRVLTVASDQRSAGLVTYSRSQHYLPSLAGFSSI